MRHASRALFLAVVAAGPAHAQETALASLAGKYCGFVPGFDERSNYVHYTVPMDLTLSPDGAYSASLGREGAPPKINGKSSLAADTLRLKPGS